MSADSKGWIDFELDTNCNLLNTIVIGKIAKTHSQSKESMNCIKDVINKDVDDITLNGMKIAAGIAKEVQEQMLWIFHRLFIKNIYEKLNQIL